jgi:hypothetical protein
MTKAHMTINDLAHFRTSKVSLCEGNPDYFELSGAFDRADDVVEGLCSLLMPDTETLTALHGNVRVENSGGETYRIFIRSEVSPEVVGMDLIYVHPRWNPRHIWMVFLPTWRWKRQQYVASDAIGKIVEGTQVSIVDGEQIRQWIQVSEKGKGDGLSRYYPMFPSGKSVLQIEPGGIIVGGWTHQHCELCHGHIEAGTYGYIDSSDHWVCEKCYERYIQTHDLSFMFQ